MYNFCIQKTYLYQIKDHAKYSEYEIKKFFQENLNKSIAWIAIFYLLYYPIDRYVCRVNFIRHI